MLLQPNPTNEPSFNTPQQQQAYYTNKLQKWLNISQSQSQSSMRILQLDISIACQYSKNQVNIPTRSESCSISCCVQKEIMEEMWVCGCGAEIDQENYYVEDWELYRVVQFVKKKYGDKVKMIRVDFQKKKIVPISPT